MSHAPIETVEEDAADLQFPKAAHQYSYPASTSLCSIAKATTAEPYCHNCRLILQEPFITCAECPRYLSCLPCFARGAEIGIHLNTHAYIITHDNIKVFPKSNWSAREERRLLDLLLRCGYGNWSDIAAGLATRTATECRDHYHQFFFDGIFTRTLGMTRHFYWPETIPFIYKSNSIEPPRHNVDMMHTKHMAGYRYARSEFDTPYDVSAESLVSHLHMDKDWGEQYEAIGNALNCAVLNAYNHRLRERHRRYRIMREHGLLLSNHTQSWMGKVSDALCLQNGQSTTTGRFIAFMQLTTGLAFDKVVEARQYQEDLKKFIFKLYELRTNGITTFEGARVFQKLRARRLARMRRKPSTSWEWKQLVPKNRDVCGMIQIQQHCMDLSNLPTKRKSAPLNIIGLPNYDKLTTDERQLCSTVRLAPDAYLAYKKILIAENSKVGYLRLADARRLIKIDVNKTRVMYDFFFEHGFINKPFT